MDHDLKNRLLLAERLPTERTQAQLPGLAPAANNLAAVAGADKSRGREKEGRAALGRITKTHAMALADQVVVSGASFLTLVAVGRMTSPTELGIYVLASSLLIWIVVAQDSLISLPYTFQQHRPLGTPAEQAGGALVYGCLLSAVITVILAVIALGASIIYAGSELPAIAWVLAAVVPFLSLRELGRRFAFAHLRLAEALILDIGVAAIQLGVLGGLAWSGQLSPTTALASIGAGCGAGGLVWLCLARRRFAIRLDQLPKMIRRSWTLGKWLFATRSSCVVGEKIATWLLAWISGVAAAGVFAACASVIMFSNPLLQGFGNILNARAAVAFEERGGAGLWQETLHNALLIGAAMALFCLVIVFAGEYLLAFLYHDPEYVAYGYVVTLLAFAVSVWAIGMPAESALITIGHPRTALLASLFGIAVTVVLTWCLVGKWGLQGAAYAELAGSMVRSAVRWARLWALIDDQEASALEANDQEQVLG